MLRWAREGLPCSRRPPICWPPGGRTLAARAWTLLHPYGGVRVTLGTVTSSVTSATHDRDTTRPERDAERDA